MTLGAPCLFTLLFHLPEFLRALSPARVAGTFALALRQMSGKYRACRLFHPIFVISHSHAQASPFPPPGPLPAPETAGKRLSYFLPLPSCLTREHFRGTHRTVLNLELLDWGVYSIYRDCYQGAACTMVRCMFKCCYSAHQLSPFLTFRSARANTASLRRPYLY